jgi:hypothetical protein
MNHRSHCSGNDCRENCGESEPMGCRQRRACPEDADGSEDQENISTDVGCQSRISFDHMQ